MGTRAPDAAHAAVDRHVTAFYERAMLAAIRRLPARQRETLVLRYYLDMSVIGSWNPSVHVASNGEQVTNDTAVIGNGTVKQFPRVTGPRVAW
jgi:hypothetical protein